MVEKCFANAIVVDHGRVETRATNCAEFTLRLQAAWVLTARASATCATPTVAARSVKAFDTDWEAEPLFVVIASRCLARTPKT